MLTFQIEQWGGLNLNDEPEKLLNRSHQFVQNVGWTQKAPVECIQCKNIDFDKNGIKKRDGSTLEVDFSSLFSVGEFVINAIQYISATNQSITVVVTNNSIYTDQSGSFAKINDSASSTYSHNATVAKCSFAVADGHLFIGLDGNNKIQVYRNGADLDDELDLGNTYEDAFGSGTNTVDGTWGTGYYLLASFQGRLIYSDGNTVVNYSSIPTATDGIWKRSTHGFYQTAGSIVAVKTFTPDYQDSIQETLYIFTSQGPQITNDLTAQIQSIQGGPVPVNQTSIIATRSWLMMLTDDRRIVAMNRNNYIDIGRRFNKLGGNSEIETFSITQSKAKSFAYYNKFKEQAYFFYPTSSSGNNKEAFVVDMMLGEPIQGEAQSSYEQRIRLSIWAVNAPTTNDFYADIINRNNRATGLTYDGKLYTLLNGRNDYGTLPVPALYETIEFRAGLPATKKMFKLMKLRGRFIANYTVNINYIFDNSVTGEITTKYGAKKYGTFKYGKISTLNYTNSESASVYGAFKYGTRKYSEASLVKGKDRVNLKGETLSIRLSNSNLNEKFSFRSLNIDYLVLNSEL